MTKYTPLQQAPLEIIDKEIKHAEDNLVYSNHRNRVRAENHLGFAQTTAEHFIRLFKDFSSSLPEQYSPPIYDSFVAQELTPRLRKIQTMRARLCSSVERLIETTYNTPSGVQPEREFLPL